MKGIVFFAVCLSFFLLTNLQAGIFNRQSATQNACAACAAAVDVPVAVVVVPPAPDACAPAACAAATDTAADQCCRRKPVRRIVKAVAKLTAKVLPPYRRCR